MIETFEQANKSAFEIRKKAQVLKNQRNEIGEPTRDDYENSSNVFYNIPDKWDRIYREQNPKDIHWNFKEIPAWFGGVMDSGWVTPCKTLDVGCGLGNYANYLAERGYNVVGVDFSNEAIERNKKNFAQENLRFEVCDALNLEQILDKKNPELFDFVIDISLLHHISPEARGKYVESLMGVTKRGAKILVSCFSQNDPVFEGKKIFHNPDSDTVTYVLSQYDINQMFQEKFEIVELEEVEFGKPSKIGNSLTRKRHLVKLVRK